MSRFSALIISICSIIFILSSCGTTDNGTADDGYNREVLLQQYSSWIQDQYAMLQNDLLDFKAKTVTFSELRDSANFAELKDAYKKAYLTWQWVDFLSIKGAADNFLVETSNTFPTNTELVEKNISEGNVNLNLINQYAAQGFPAIDYLLFNASQAETLAAFNNQNRIEYLKLLTNRIELKTSQVMASWSANEQAFIEDSGSDAGSSIAVVFNALVKNFERRTRDAKIGLPAGVRTDNVAQPIQAEALYSAINLDLALENVRALKSFFNCSDIDGFDNYLNYLEAERNGTPLSNVINGQFDNIISALNTIESDLSTSVVNDKTKAIAVFNEMQKLVIYLKVDMAAELGILINYADNDGDS